MRSWKGIGEVGEVLNKLEGPGTVRVGRESRGLVGNSLVQTVLQS